MTNRSFGAMCRFTSRRRVMQLSANRMCPRIVLVHCVAEPTDEWTPRRSMPPSRASFSVCERTGWHGGQDEWLPRKGWGFHDESRIINFRVALASERKFRCGHVGVSLRCRSMGAGVIVRLSVRIGQRSVC